jgi:hypothetical protein
MSCKRSGELYTRRSFNFQGLVLCLLVVALVQLDAMPALAQADTTAVAPSKTASQLEVAEIATGLAYDLVRKAPVDTASVFTADVEKVICYTRIKGAESPTQITHVWYHEGQIKAQVKLDIGSANWRTYSSKRLLPAWTGPWEVKVLDDSGTVLATAAFTIQ